MVPQGAAAGNADAKTQLKALGEKE